MSNKDSLMQFLNDNGYTDSLKKYNLSPLPWKWTDIGSGMQQLQDANGELVDCRPGTICGRLMEVAGELLIVVEAMQNLSITDQTIDILCKRTTNKILGKVSKEEIN